MLALLFLTFSTARADTDVTQNFLQFATSYCSGGKVTNADIGNGNIFGSADFEGFEWSEEAREEYAAEIEARFGSSIYNLEGVKPGGVGIDDCNEAHGNTCVHNAGQYTWCNYPQHKCMSKYASQIGAITYPTMQQTEGAPTIYTFYYDNDLDQATSFKINREISTSNQQVMSVTNKMSVGTSLKLTGGEPGIMTEEVSFTVSFDMEESRSWQTTSTQSFTFETSIPVDAGSTTMANMTIAKAVYKGTWAAQVDLPYYAKLWCEDQTNGHNEWFIPAHYFMGDAPYEGSGRFTGGAGYDSHVSAVKCPLYARTPSACDGESVELKKVKVAVA